MGSVAQRHYERGAMDMPRNRAEPPLARARLGCRVFRHVGRSGRTLGSVPLDYFSAARLGCSRDYRSDLYSALAMVYDIAINLYYTILQYDTRRCLLSSVQPKGGPFSPFLATFDPSRRNVNRWTIVGNSAGPTPARVCAFGW